MVMLSSTLRGRVFKFHSHALSPNTLVVVSYQGREAISQPFRFEVDLLSKKADLDATAILQCPAFLGIKQGVPLSGEGKRGVQTLKLHGVLASFEQFGKVSNAWVSYRAVLVPKLWQLSIGKHTRIFQDKKVPEIVEEVLKGAGFGSDEYEFRTSAREYPKSEYVVQYQESDLNFLSRLLEHEGLFYFFEHGDEGTKVVFGDSAAASVPILGESTLPYRPQQAGSPVPAGDWFDQEKIVTLGFRESRIPSEVVLRDYNYRTPSVDLKVSAPVVAEGFGQYYEYGNHYKDQGEGKAYAQVRAEELKCRQKTFRGESDCRSFRAGQTYTLADHYRPGFNTTYLLTSVKHTGSQTIELAGVASRVSSTYSNEFEAIPGDVPFRPERVTPKPRIYGTMHATVDAAGDGKYAEIDDQGRYKVQIPFDLSGKDKATATRWIRKAEPYTGPDYGIHFPLHKGAEVILTHIDGDPDRPIIANAVPNPEMGSPVKGENQQQCVIKTGGGNKMVISDGEGGENVTLFSPHASTKLSMGGPGSGFKMNTDADREYTIQGNGRDDIAGNYNVQIGGISHSIVCGATTKMELAASLTLTVGAKATFENSYSLTRTAGAQISLRDATTFERTAGGKIQKQANKIANADALYKVTAGAAIQQKAPLVTITGTGRAAMISGGTSLVVLPGGGLLKSGGFLKMTAGGPINMKAGGPLGVDAAQIQMKTGRFEVNSGPIGLKGGDIFLEGSSATIACKLEVKKKATFLSDCDIKGNVDVKGKGNIKGKFSAGGASLEAG